MLGMSYFFFELQRAGPLPPDTRMPWRGDTLKKEGGGNLDGQFQGGYFDAGDHNKFMLPQAFSTARLAWGLHAHGTAHEQTYFDVRVPNAIVLSFCVTAMVTMLVFRRMRDIL